MRTELQLNVVRGIASELSEKHRMIQHATIAMLGTKLKIAINNVESTIKSHPIGDQELEVHRWKYALMKEKIDRTIEDLKEWQSCSHYLTHRGIWSWSSQNSQIDDGLRKNRRSSAMKFQDPIPPAQSLRAALHPTDGHAPSVRLSSDSLISINPQEIPFCSAQVGRRLDNERPIARRGTNWTSSRGQCRGHEERYPRSCQTAGWVRCGRVRSP